MKDPNYLPKVRAQYEEYPYPTRIPEDENKRLLLTCDDGIDAISHYGFGGMRDLRKGCRVLVAGGGTGDSAIWLAEQLRDGPSEVVYVDISEASMAIAQARAEVRGLTNIRWHHGSLLDIADIDAGPFDYINSAGVLHHLKDPAAGLRALRGVLAKDGLMGLMVYGKHARAGLAQMQELLRLIGQGTEDTPLQIRRTYQVLESLPPSNVFKRHGEDLFVDVKDFGDTGVYDLFLHSQECTYTVPELNEWLDACGMHMLAFSDPACKRAYLPKYHIKEPELREHIAGMPLKTQYAIGELLYGAAVKHTFYTAPAPRTPARIDDPDMVPFISTLFYADGIYAELHRQFQQRLGEVVRIFNKAYRQQISLHATPYTAAIFQYLDGQRTVDAILRAIRQDPAHKYLDAATLKDTFRKVCTYLEDAGWLLLRHKDIPSYPSMNHYSQAQTQRRQSVPS